MIRDVARCGSVVLANLRLVNEWPFPFPHAKGCSLAPRSPRVSRLKEPSRSGMAEVSTLALRNPKRAKMKWESNGMKARKGGGKKRADERIMRESATREGTKAQSINSWLSVGLTPRARRGKRERE